MPAFRKLYTDFYIKLVNKAPALWGHLYHATHDAPRDSSMQRLRRAVERLNTRALMTQIAAFQPDAIICTHFLPAELLSRALRQHLLSCPVWVQVTRISTCTACGCTNRCRAISPPRTKRRSACATKASPPSVST